MSENSGHGLKSVALVVLLAAFAYVAFRVDSDPGKAKASCAVTVVGTALAFYFTQLRFPKMNEIYDWISGLRGTRIPRNESTFIRTDRKYRFPPIISLTLLVGTLLWFENTMLEGFVFWLEKFNFGDDAFINLQVVNGGELFFSSLLPLSAAWASKIGFRPRPIRWREVIFASIATVGLIAVMTAVSAALSGSSPTEAILRALFVGQITAPAQSPLSVSGKGYMVALTVAQGLLLVLLSIVWLWLWARYGHWRFRRQYTAVPSGRA